MNLAVFDYFLGNYKKHKGKHDNIRGGLGGRVGGGGAGGEVGQPPFVCSYVFLGSSYICLVLFCSFVCFFFNFEHWLVKV